MTRPPAAGAIDQGATADLLRLNDDRCWSGTPDTSRGTRLLEPGEGPALIGRVRASLRTPVGGIAELLLRSHRTTAEVTEIAVVPVRVRLRGPGIDTALEPRAGQPLVLAAADRWAVGNGHSEDRSRPEREDVVPLRSGRPAGRPDATRGDP